MKKILCKMPSPVFAVIVLVLVAGCQKNAKDVPGSVQDGTGGNVVSPKEFKDFVQVNLLANNDKFNAQYVDPNFIDPWGIACASSGPMMVPLAGKGNSTFVTIDGVCTDLPVSIPPGLGGAGIGHPTGVVCNASAEFILPNGNPAKFIFASTEGTICGWNAGTNAMRMVNNTGPQSYRGVAISPLGEQNFIYAANFAQGRIDVYDGNWLPVNRSFTDPNLPAGYSPFNIQLIDSKLYVMYAKRNSTTGEEEKGSGKGFINIFNTDGTLFRRFASQGQLNAPWGIAKAPTKFWGYDTRFPDMYLVGNFGNGQINVFDENGNFVSTLRSRGKPLEIDGLWALAFPPGPYNTLFLYFTAGPNDETNGLFGYIKNMYIN